MVERAWAQSHSLQGSWEGEEGEAEKEGVASPPGTLPSPLVFLLDPQLLLVGLPSSVALQQGNSF